MEQQEHACIEIYWEFWKKDVQAQSLQRITENQEVGYGTVRARLLTSHKI
jgi:hypothetical protein